MLREHVVKTFVMLLLFSLTLGVLERKWPARAALKTLRPEWFNDVVWWFVGPPMVAVMQTVAGGAAMLGAWLVANIDQRTAHLLGPLRATVGHQSVGLQFVEVLAIADLLGYWVHRTVHARPRLWRLHAIHHSAEHYDWLSAARQHPVEPLVTQVAPVFVVALLGFRIEAIAAYFPFLGLFGLLLHSNVRWDFGPLRYVIVSPSFHRWHHSSDEGALDKNFAGLFPVWDLMFGTFYMPRAARPARFGVRDNIPRGIVRQLIWPFRQTSR